MNIKNLDLNLLRVLDAVVSERHVSRAASRLHLSQPAMSNALNRLRAALDDPILVRGKGGMLPTPRAEALAGPVRETLAALEQALLASQSFTPAGLSQTFTLIMPDYYALLLLPLLRQRIAQQAPGVRLALLGFSEGSVGPLLDSGSADLAMGLGERLKAPHLLASDLFCDDFVVVARAGHDTINGSLSLEQYLAADHVLVSTQGGKFHGYVDQVLEARGLQRKVVLSVPQFLIAPSLIQQCGQLVATIPGRLAAHYASHYPLQVLPPPIELDGFQVQQIWHPRTDNDPAQRWLRQLVSEVAAELSPCAAGAQLP